MDTVIGLGLVITLAALDQFLFKALFGISHLDWYLKNGISISVITTLVSMTWSDMKEMTGIISAHPLKYLKACCRVMGLPFLVFGTHMRTNKAPSEPRSFFDTLMTIPLVLLFVTVILAWLIAVVPLQYFVYLVCGAPARLFAASTRRTIARMSGGNLETEEIEKGQNTPDGWWDASLASKPVTSTNLFATMLFLVLQTFLR